MLNLLKDGLVIFNAYSVGIIIFFLCIYGLGMLPINNIMDDNVDQGYILGLSFGSGSIILCVCSYILILFGHLWSSLLTAGSLIIMSLALIGIIYAIRSNRVILKPDFNILLAGLAVLLLLLARLAYLNHIILPPYSDSPIHYQIVMDLMNGNNNHNLKLSLDTLLVNYYHFGFHAIAVWFTAVSKIDPLTSIPLLGQLFLTIAPINIASLVYIITKNKRSAIFSGLIAALGWLMPGFAVNWGKFPAVTAITTMPVILALSWMYAQSKIKKISLLIYILFLSFGIILIHTRILICLALALACFLLVTKLKTNQEAGFLRSIFLSLLFTLSLWPFLPIIKNFYDYRVFNFIMLLLLPFAFKSYYKISIGVFLFLFGMWIISLPILRINGQDLLDRQFQAIFLYIPFTLISSLGFAGFLENIKPKKWTEWIFIIIILMAVLQNPYQTNKYYPNSCCNYFDTEDQLAFQWIKKNISTNSLFIISTADNFDKASGTDSGIWIYPLTNIPTNKMRFDTNWETASAFNEVCHAQIKHLYIYAGNEDFSFTQEKINKLLWAKPLYQNKSVIIYEVVCPK